MDSGGIGGYCESKAQFVDVSASEMVLLRKIEKNGGDEVLRLAVIIFSLMLSSLSFGQFSEVSGAAGNATQNARGAAWFDYNNDGCMDLFVSQSSGGTLFQSNCDKTFTDTTVAAGIVLPGDSWAATAGDYDGDGNMDLYVTANDGEANTLFHNNGDGTFSDVSAAAGVDDVAQSTGASWADYDGDGDLDLFVANRWPSPLNPNVNDRLYRNNGDGTFTDVASTAGVAGPNGRQTFSGQWFDYDNNGTLDLYLAVDFGGDVLYSNNSAGVFNDVSVAAGIFDPEHGMGISLADYNFDGCIDILSSNNNGSGGQPDTSEHGPSAFYENNCDGTFTNVAAARGILDREVVEWGLNFVDWDNDADYDVSIVAGGMLSSGEPNVLYENNTIGQMIDVTADAGVSNSGAAFGSAWADYDNDGDLDWYVANDDGGPSVFFENTGSVGNWLKIDLDGPAGNVDGIGARIEVTSGGRTQTRYVQAGTSYTSSEPLTLLFGLGVKDSADVRVEWPDGSDDTMSDVAAGQTITMTHNGGGGGPTTGDIMGVISDSNTGLPLEGARVRIILSGSIIDEVFTDVNGEYQTIQMDPATYRVQVNNPGYQVRRVQTTVTAGNTTNLNLTMTQ